MEASNLASKTQTLIMIRTVHDHLPVCITSLERYKIFLEHLNTGKGKWYLRGAVQPRNKSPERIAVEKSELDEWKAEKIRKYKDLFPYSVSGNAIRLWDAQNMEKALQVKKKSAFPAGFDFLFALAFEMMVRKSTDVEYFYIHRVTEEDGIRNLRKVYPELAENIIP